LWDTGGEGGPVAEQGALQQTLRGGGGTSLRERGGTPGGATDGFGCKYGAGHRSALRGAMGGEAAPATAAPDGGGRNLPGQEGRVPHCGVQFRDRGTVVVWQGPKEGDAG